MRSCPEDVRVKTTLLSPKDTVVGLSAGRADSATGQALELMPASWMKRKLRVSVSLLVAGSTSGPRKSQYSLSADEEIAVVVEQVGRAHAAHLRARRGERARGIDAGLLDGEPARRHPGEGRGRGRADRGLEKPAFAAGFGGFQGRRGEDRGRRE